ncbi:hypothetical protein SLEP1_g27615 [Rubroshorea leprosula]|uniref:Uncharacterized protein n=1 Tax=Rubroshorea leprosula TaxID=152421 RepID=A0AAV5K095_9ROSI|nr:hypothetical protein SLEP1_g27615 [Rubroshorea leprosula]
MRRRGQDGEGEGFDDEEHVEETGEEGPSQAASSRMTAPLGPRRTRGDMFTTATYSEQ